MATASSFGDGRYAVLLMAYGTPRTPEEVEPYLLDVRGGRPTPPDLVRELRERYEAIGASPLLERTEAQAAGLAHALGDGTAVYIGMRHWHPYIADAMQVIREDGYRRVVALALAPHYSRLSVGAYRKSLESASDGADTVMVPSWSGHAGFLDAVAAEVRDALGRFPDPGRVRLLFTAHSLPTRILADGDPYPDLLRTSVEGVLERIGRTDGRIAYQSAGRSAEPWLGPDAETVMREMAAEGAREMLICPIGFVSDHLEVLYDVDIELQEVAQALGVRLERTRSLNDTPPFMTALADLVRETAAAAGWT